MGMSEVVIQKSLKVLDRKVTHNGYIVDEQGKETQINLYVTHGIFSNNFTCILLVAVPQMR